MVVWASKSGAVEPNLNVGIVVWVVWVVYGEKKKEKENTNFLSRVCQLLNIYVQGSTPQFG